MSTSDGALRIKALAGQMEMEDAANTMLFLSHFSKDAVVIDAIVARADEIYGHVTATTLNKDAVPSAARVAEIYKAVYVQRPIAEARRDLLRALDANPLDQLPPPRTTEIADESDSLSKPTAEQVEGEDGRQFEDIRDYLNRMSTALRILQVLGQLLKNFPGSLVAAQKLLIAESAYQVGLRLLASVHALIENNQTDLVEEIVDQLKRMHPDISDEALQSRAMDAVAWHVYISAYGIVQRIATSVATVHLSPIFDKLRETSPTPANRLISLAIALDRAGGFMGEDIVKLHDGMSDNPLAQRVLRTVVLNHLHLFDVAVSDKQSVCAQIGIEYKSVGPGVDTRLKRLPRSASRPT